jgi:hypothetical protein
MPRFNNINGERVQFTQAEETARDLEEAQYALEVEEELLTQYQRDRASAYPSLADQLDKIYHSGVAGWKADIKVIKDANPKPE